MLKDLLLVVDSGFNDDAVLHGARSLARAHNAHLTVLVIASIPTTAQLIVPYPALISCEENRKRVTAKLERLSALENPSVEGRQLDDSAASLVVEIPDQCRCADVVLFGGAGSWQDEWLRRHVLDMVVLGTGRPVLLLPDHGRVPSFTRSVVGWNASVEATRAVHSALPHLDRDGEVTIAVILSGAHDERFGAEPGFDLATHFARHDLSVSVEQNVQPHRDDYQALTALSVARDADLLIIGASGRSKLRDFLFGGVTRDALKSTPLPIWLMN